MVKGIIFDFFGVFVGASAPGQREEDSVNIPLIQYTKQLSQKYPIGLLSNADKGYLLSFMKEYGLESVFTHCIASSEVGYHKPQEEIFKIAVEKFDISPDSLIFIDDSERNTQGAKKAGLMPILYKDVTILKAELSDLGVRL